MLSCFAATCNKSPSLPRPPAPAPRPLFDRSYSALTLVQALARMLHHFQSIPWMTYRAGFTPIAVGDVQLRSDAGWGCTLRR